MVARTLVLLGLALSGLTAIAQDSVLYGRSKGYQVWCDPLRVPLIVELMGLKYGGLDTLVNSGTTQTGELGQLTQALETGTWTYRSEKLGLNIELELKKPTQRQMHLRRRIFNMEAYWTIRDLCSAHAFPEYGMSPDLTGDFDNFLHRRAGTPAYITDFYTALRLRDEKK
jgi:hypothetical protein